MDGEEWDAGEEGVFLECATCGDVEEHAVLRAAASAWTVECLECRTKQTVAAPPKPRTIVVPII
ncbi:MAG: hypothetical protein LC623_07180, partial [Halobacteriales archaeon]|nr:hypothetical protein [Halobacteriales archaeon]